MSDEKKTLWRCRALLTGSTVWLEDLYCDDFLRTSEGLSLMRDGIKVAGPYPRDELDGFEARLHPPLKADWLPTGE